ncbi:hypothetical protein GCM10023334_117400 [Nonomuraea thailandensis]
MLGSGTTPHSTSERGPAPGADGREPPRWERCGPSPLHDTPGAEQHDDPALVIGAAKEFIESTAKLVLHELGHTIDPRADIQELIREAQKALLLQPNRAAGPDGIDAVNPCVRL